MKNSMRKILNAGYYEYTVLFLSALIAWSTFERPIPIFIPCSMLILEFEFFEAFEEVLISNCLR